jgi:hypothetical protein
VLLDRGRDGGACRDSPSHPRCFCFGAAASWSGSARVGSPSGDEAASLWRARTTIRLQDELGDLLIAFGQSVGVIGSRTIRAG